MRPVRSSALPMRACAFSLTLSVGAAACEPAPSQPAPVVTSASPNASILPVPLTTEFAPAGSASDAPTKGLALSGAGYVKKEVARLAIDDGTLRPEVQLPKELYAVVVEGAWRWKDASAQRQSDTNAEAFRHLQTKSELGWTLVASESGRAKIVIRGIADTLALGTEIRAREDRAGYVLLWPDFENYRAIPRGALRTSLAERRVDVAPLAAATLTKLGGASRLGAPIRRVVLDGSLAKLTMGLAKALPIGSGGPLLCEMFLELAGIDPALSAPCEQGEFPLDVSIDWARGGGAIFEATSVKHRQDIPHLEVVLLPTGPKEKNTELPVAGAGAFFSKKELEALRSQDAKVAVEPDAPGEGALLRNNSEDLLYVTAEGVPIAWVSPGAETQLVGLRKGEWAVGWRSRFGARNEPVKRLVVPGRWVAVPLTDEGKTK